MRCPSLKTFKEKSAQMGSENEIHLKIRIWNCQSSMKTIFISVAHLTRQGRRSNSTRLCLDKRVRLQKDKLCLPSNGAQINCSTYAPKWNFAKVILLTERTFN